MRKYIPELMPLIVEALLDGAAVTKREVAVATLGQVVQSTGYAPCSPYIASLRLILADLIGRAHQTDIANLIIDVNLEFLCLFSYGE